jgi:hypothetical protein
VEISRLQRKEKYFKNTKRTAIRPKNDKLSAIIFVVFISISLLAKVLKFPVSYTAQRSVLSISAHTVTQKN